MFNKFQQERLMKAASTGKMANIDSVIKSLMAEDPGQFHNKESLKLRKFHHAPRPSNGLVYESAVIPFPQDQPIYKDEA